MNFDPFLETWFTHLLTLLESFSKSKERVHLYVTKIVKHHLPYMSDIYRAQIQNVLASGI